MKGRLYKMDKRKYQAKRLICEFQDLGYEDCRFSEKAYLLKDGSIIIEYDGNPYSIYGVKLDAFTNIARKGVYSISNSDFELWKSIRKQNEYGCFIDWQEQYNEQLIQDYESTLKCIGENDLPF